MERFEDILKRMEDAYRAQSGGEAEDVSDTALRLRVLAGELTRLWARAEWLKVAAFPQTALGEALDLHGESRGLTRTPAACAEGIITFSRYLPLSFDLVIPAGTVCAVPGEQPVEYETTEEAVLPAGDVSVDAPARAARGGKAGNCASGRINALISAPEGLNYCTNRDPFTGGADPEDDESYRRRILAAFIKGENGTNTAYYEAAAMQVAGVASAQAVAQPDGPGTVGLYVWGAGSPPGEETLAAVREKLAGEREIGVTVTVAAASARTMNVTGRMRAAPGTDFAAALEAVRGALSALYAEKQVGDPVYLTELYRAMLAAADLERIEFAAAVRDFSGAEGVIPVLGAVTLEQLS